MTGQISLFDLIKPPPLKVDLTKQKVVLIELFAGIGAQAKALEKLGIPFESRICEYDKYAVQSYNAIHKTNFTPSDITKLKGSDLHIDDTERNFYITTYSFPCQDLSLAGKQKSMAKGSGTRSSLLWEVERLLNECDILPQMLVMENVTAVHGTKNASYFKDWIAFLESKGYTNVWKDMNSKDYGVPQNRNRTFMVSFLGNYSYDFPEPIRLKKVMGDLLDDNVDEKYYLSDKGIAYVLSQKRGMATDINPENAQPITAKGNANWTGSFVSDNIDHLEKSSEIGGTAPVKVCMKDGSSFVCDEVLGVNGDISKTIRGGGRNDIHKKHSWDLVYGKV